MLKEELMKDLKEAMKEKNTIKKDTVQMVRAAILQIEKDKGIEVDDNKIIEIIAKEVIASLGATSMKDMGPVMKEAKAKIGAAADGRAINEVVKDLLG